MIQPGDFNTRVVIRQLKALTPDASGHVNEADETNWETYCERWAMVSYRTGTEGMFGDQIQARRFPVVRLISDPATRAITTSMKVAMPDGRKLNIAEPPRDVKEGREVVEIACIEVS